MTPPQFCRVVPILGAVSGRPSINRAAGGDWPELLDAIAADADIPVVEIDGRVAVAGDEAHLVADVEPVRRARNTEPAVLVGGALVGGSGLVADERRAGIEGERLEPGIDDDAVLSRAARPASAR